MASTPPQRYRRGGRDAVQSARSGSKPFREAKLETAPRGAGAKSDAGKKAPDARAKATAPTKTATAKASAPASKASTSKAPAPAPAKKPTAKRRS